MTLKCTCVDLLENTKDQRKQNIAQTSEINNLEHFSRHIVGVLSRTNTWYRGSYIILQVGLQKDVSIERVHRDVQVCAEKDRHILSQLSNYQNKLPR